MNLFKIIAEVPLEDDDPACQNFLLQRYEQRIESLSQTDRVSKFCMDAGFVSFVEIGQYFMTKDAGEQFYAKACREFILPRSDESSPPIGWIQVNTKIGPVLEITTSFQHFKVLAKKFGVGQWSFIGPGSEKKWYPSENSPQGAWDHIAEEMFLKFAESGHPIFRSTTPLSRGRLKSKGKGKVSIHFSADQDTVDTIFRIILSVNQLSVYGAVAAVCEDFEDHQDRTGQPVILVGQSIVLGEVKAEVPLHNENPMNDQIIWQQYIQQVESLSP